jgi:hypothetical protein
MIRNITLALLASATLSACVSSGYGYRGGSGDYYYGRPAAGHYGYPGPYGSAGYGSGGWYGGAGYGYPAYGGYYSGAPSGYYYRPGYGYYAPYYPPYRPVVVRPPHQHKPRPPRVDPPGDPGSHEGGGVSWRDLERLKARKYQGTPRQVPAQVPTASSRLGGVATAPPVHVQPRPDVSPDRGRAAIGRLMEARAARGGGEDSDRETP